MSTRKDAIGRLASTWGWKGGKPGEVTGTQYMNDLNVKPEDLVPRLEQDFYLGTDDIASAGGADLLMQWFADMERAGIPREWTGKIAKKLWNSKTALADIPFDESNTGLRSTFQELSDAMRPMTDEQRELFVQNELPRIRYGITERARAFLQNEKLRSMRRRRGRQ
jgi:hypothetical protein